jgi:small subunit ribosomal protein S10
MPTSINKFCVLRSPHVDKKSREQFEMRTHRRLLDILEPTQQTIELLDILEPTQQTIDSLMKLELSAGVDVEIKLP